MQIYKVNSSDFSAARGAWLGAVEAGDEPDFPSATRTLREADWRVSGPLPATLCVSGLDGVQEAAALADGLRRLAGDGGLRLRADTLHGTFEIEETLHALRDLVCEVEADYDAYLFGFVQAFHARPGCILPDRADITPQTNLLRSYTRLLERVCERRGATLIGAAQDAGISDEPDGDAAIEAGDLLHVPQGRITEQGIHTAIRTALGWLCRCGDPAAKRVGAEQLDAAAAAELARAQLWQWVQLPTGVLDRGEIVSDALFRRLLEAECAVLGELEDSSVLVQAAERLAAIVLSESFTMHALCEFPGQNPAG